LGLGGLYEQWINTRKVGKIKSTMLAKEVHAEVCGEQDAMNAALSCFDVLFSEFATLSLLQSSSVSKLRGIQSNLKPIRSYSVAVHGINFDFEPRGQQSCQGASSTCSGVAWQHRVSSRKSVTELRGWIKYDDMIGIGIGMI